MTGISGKMTMGRTVAVAIALTLCVTTTSGLIAPAVQAQFSDSYNFLKAVRDRKGEEATEMLSAPGSVIVNTRDGSTGQTALHIVVERRDAQWLGFLLGKDANPNLADKKGTTPLMLATQLGFPDGIDWLVRFKADVDQTNRSGETALIWAVQLRKPEMVRLLLKAGANPDKQDSVAGLSARDYATQDGRASAILAIIEGNDKTDKTVKPAELDFSGIGEAK